MEEGSGGVSASQVHDTYDYLFKFLVIGSAGTGKSCLLHQFIEGRFKDDSSHTIGVEFGSKIVPVGGKTVKLQVCFDLQERLNTPFVWELSLFRVISYEKSCRSF